MDKERLTNLKQTLQRNKEFTTLDVIEQLEQQIEQMKCCANCKHSTQGEYDGFENCRFCHSADCECQLEISTKNSVGRYHDWDDKCNNWELAE